MFRCWLLVGKGLLVAGELDRNWLSEILVRTDLLSGDQL